MRKITCLALILLVMITFGIANAETINIMTTPPGTYTHSAGSAIGKVIIEKAGLNASVQPQAIRAFGAINDGVGVFSMTDSSDLALAVQGLAWYKDQGPRPHLRLAASLMPMKTALFVRKNSDIKKISDLRGKRIGYGFHAQRAIGRAIAASLANGGLTYDDVKKVPAPNIASAARDFGTGKADAMFFAVGSGKVMEIAAKVGGLRVLGLDDSPEAVARFHKVHPLAYLTTVKPAPHHAGVTEPVKVATVNSIIFTHDRAPDDVIYKVVKAIYENKKDLAASFAPFRSFNPKQIARSVEGVAYHPGAIKFFKEVGVWPSK